METNPYAPPKADLAGPGRILEAEALRRDHLNAEGNLRSVGALYLFGAALLVAALVNWGIKWNAGNAPNGILLVVIAVGALTHGPVGLALFQLKAGARWWATVLALVGLVGFPLGTAIGCYVLYQVNNRRGRFILSPEYASIRAKTSHLDVKPNSFRLLMLGLILVLLVGTALLVFSLS